MVLKLVSPRDQFLNGSPARSLKQRYLDKAKNTLECGGWSALEQLLSRTFDDTASDDLTGLFNRRMFFVLLRKNILPHLRRVASKAGRHAALGTLVAIDLDRFKLINERFGHAGGNEVLRVFGPMLAGQFRQDDVVGRVGGDEFVVIAIGLTVSDVEARMKALQEKFSMHQWKLHPIDPEDHTGIAESFSFSYSSVGIDDPDQIEMLIDRADRNVFKKKRERRVRED